MLYQNYTHKFHYHEIQQSNFEIQTLCLISTTLHVSINILAPLLTSFTMWGQIWRFSMFHQMRQQPHIFHLEKVRLIEALNHQDISLFYIMKDLFEGSNSCSKLSEVLDQGSTLLLLNHQSKLRCNRSILKKLLVPKLHWAMMDWVCNDLSWYFSNCFFSHSFFYQSRPDKFKNPMFQSKVYYHGNQLLWCSYFNFCNCQ